MCHRPWDVFPTQDQPNGVGDVHIPRISLYLKARGTCKADGVGGVKAPIISSQARSATIATVPFVVSIPVTAIVVRAVATTAVASSPESTESDSHPRQLHVPEGSSPISSEPNPSRMRHRMAIRPPSDVETARGRPARSRRTSRGIPGSRSQPSPLRASRSCRTMDVISFSPSS